MVQSYTADGLVAAWPVPGVDMGGGWKIEDTDVKAATCRPLPILSSRTVYIEVEDDDSATRRDYSGRSGRVFRRSRKRFLSCSGNFDFVFLAQYEACARASRRWRSR